MMTLKINFECAIVEKKFPVFIVILDFGTAEKNWITYLLLWVLATSIETELSNHFA